MPVGRFWHDSILSLDIRMLSLEYLLTSIGGADMEQRNVVIDRHTWPERRRWPRRIHSDRREMIRFAPDKADRRDGSGRREKEDQLWDAIRQRF